MPRLFLVRHATSVPPAHDGPDEYHRPLSEVGLRQAEALAEVLASLSPRQVLSSPYLRSVQTVAPTAAALGLHVEKREVLREWDSGIGATSMWERHYRDCWNQPERSVGGGESHLALQRRAVHALRDLAADLTGADDVLVASHGAWIARALLGLGCRVDADFWLAMPMPAVFAIKIDGERLRASSHSMAI